MKKNKSALDEAFSPENFRMNGHALVDRLADYLRDAMNRSYDQVQPWKNPEVNLADWPSDFSNGPSAGFSDFIEKILRDSIRLHHPRYMGHQVSAPLPHAALLDFVGALLNNCMVVYEMGPAATAIELNLVKWMGTKLGFGAGCGGTFTSGGTLGTLTALLAARQAKGGGDVWNQGVSNRELAVVASEQCHYCVSRAVKTMGLGADGIIAVKTDDRFRMNAQGVAEAIDAAKSNGKKVFAVVASACSTSTGSFDPIEEIAAVCRKNGAWLHVDGAHGAAAILSDKYKGLVQGIELADSVVWDAHKMCMMPSLVTAVLFRDENDSYKAFAQHAPYLFEPNPLMKYFNQAERSFECAKRMLAFQLYGCLKLFGTDIFSEYVDRTFDLAREFAAMIRQNGDFELAIEPQANILCFRHVPAGCPDADSLNVHVRQTMLKDGKFYLVQTKLRGSLFLRTTLMNPFTTSEDLSDLLVEIRKAAATWRENPEEETKL